MEGNVEIAGGYNVFSSIYNLASLVCLILIWIKIGFIAFISYLGIFIGVNIIGLFLFSLPIWKYLNSGGCLSPLISILTAIWTFIALFRLY